MTATSLRAALPSALACVVLMATLPAERAATLPSTGRTRTFLTGTPEVGGITTREALALLHGLSGLHLIGGDVVEVAPPFDPSGNTALVGATLLYEIVCLLAESRAGAGASHRKR
jgi:hypothetical protein